MKPCHKQLFCFILFALPITIHTWGRSEPYDDSWMEPDSWSTDEKCCKCTDISIAPQPPKYEQLETVAETGKFSEDGVALLYLRRWLMQLFDRKKMVHTDKKHRRSLTFSLTASQLEKIEKWNDVRDLDEVITEVFSNAYKNGECYSTVKPTGFFPLIRDILIDFVQLTKISEIRFLLMVILVAICGWFLHWNYHIPYWAMVAGGLFLFGYLHTYLECNRELEVNEMLETLKSSEKENMSVLTRYWNRFFKTPVDTNAEFKKSAKLKLGFCRPDEVAIMYFTNIFLKYLQILIEQGSGIVNIFNSQLSFPFSYLAPVMFVCLICYFVKLTFMYVLRPAVSSYIWQGSNRNGASIAHGDGDNAAHVKDRISGDNLKTLLNLIKPAIANRMPEVPPAMSGVEEVREALEATAANDISTSSESSKNSSTSKVNPNSNASKKDKNLSPYNDVKMEDLPDES